MQVILKSVDKSGKLISERNSILETKVDEMQCWGNYGQVKRTDDRVDGEPGTAGVETLGEEVEDHRKWKVNETSFNVVLYK